MTEAVLAIVDTLINASQKDLLHYLDGIMRQSLLS
jgi:hypothetical protein